MRHGGLLGGGGFGGTIVVSLDGDIRGTGWSASFFLDYTFALCFFDATNPSVAAIHGVHEARGELKQWPDCIRLLMVKQSRNAQWHMRKGCFSRKGSRPPLLPSLLIAAGAAVVRHHQVAPKNRGSTDPMDDGDNNRPDDTNFSKKECDY
nr:hypothetical protein [Tanacetum cinerariifolium]